MTPRSILYVLVFSDKRRVAGTYEKVISGLPYIIGYALNDEPPEGGTLTVLHIIHGARDWPEGSWPGG